MFLQMFAIYCIHKTLLHILQSFVYAKLRAGANDVHAAMCKCTKSMYHFCVNVYTGRSQRYCITFRTHVCMIFVNRQRIVQYFMFK